MNDRDTVLERVRRALQDDSREPDSDVTRAYRQSSEETVEVHVAQFVQRVQEYQAVAHVVAAGELAGAIASICTDRAIRSLVVPDDIPSDWLPEGIRLERDSRREPLSNERLDRSDGVLTACALGIAQTGTLVLDGGIAQGRRAITLLPDYHLCVIRSDQVVGIVPEAVTFLRNSSGESARPLTFISGPSATSDIELNRVEGVHGPRTLEVLVVLAHSTAKRLVG